MFHILLSKCKQSETLSADLEPGGHERHGCQIKRNKKNSQNFCYYNSFMKTISKGIKN